MIIKHYPITKIEQVEKVYSEKDGVPVKHVCTTEFRDFVADVFYRETPHPDFGNKYFAILFREDQPYIANADQIENFTFGMVENDEGDLEYSQSRHDYKSFQNGNMIDGGRDYIRSSGKVKVFTVRDGKMVNFSTGNEDGRK
jgi:hypothetical protein